MPSTPNRRSPQCYPFIPLLSTLCLFVVADVTAFAPVLPVVGASATPSLSSLASNWLSAKANFSAHTSAAQVDVPSISNFWGSVGAGAASARPVDVVAVSSVELPPFAGCGVSSNAAYGCGSLFVDGHHVDVTATRWAAYEMSRRAAVLPSGVEIVSSTRMVFEANAVLWNVSFTNADLLSSRDTVTLNVSFGLAAMFRQYAEVQWVETLVSDPTEFRYTAVHSPFSGVISEGLDAPSNSSRPAAAVFAFAGVQPDGVVGGDTPSAWFNVQLPPGASSTVQLVLTVADTSTTALASAGVLTSSFDTAFDEGHTKWEDRWQAAFTPGNSDFSGWLPSLSLDGADARSAPITRVFYMSALSVLSLLRTNLPIVAPRVFVTSAGNVESSDRGIGGAAQWYWDEALSSLMLSLLIPDSRAATMQAWMATSPMGQGGNWFQLDCQPPGSPSCTYPPSQGDVYCYNIWSLFVGIANHLRVNNDTQFLHAEAGSSGRSVQQNLEAMAMFWRAHLVNNTRYLLVDYGPDLDGFSPTYQHVKPGCSQGNTAWMLRQMARLKDVQGDSGGASQFRAYAEKIATSTMAVSYDKGGYFDIIYPDTTVPSGLRAYEYRHVVDFFSVVFGFCGDKSTPCDFSASVRSQLSTFFHTELRTASWIRATSPACNCSRTWPVADSDSDTDAKPSTSTDTDVAEQAWPGLVTCDGSREDHGTTGSYSAWPALACEAMCYVDGNCSAAMDTLASFAPNTELGPFGQASAVPQNMQPPYTPYNDEPSFKPADRRFNNMATGAFMDGMIRGMFGYHPDLVWPSEPTLEALTAMLFRPSDPRGFNGALSNLRTPFGMATIVSNATGLHIALR